jgi:hypothetical protein
MLANLNSRTAPLLLSLLVLLTLWAGGAFADDEKVWAALKRGGKVILLRHGHVDIQEGIGRLLPGNCAEEVNLSSRGLRFSRAVVRPPRYWRERDRKSSRETVRLPVDAARLKAREILNQLPQGGYMTVVEQWRQLPGGQIEFTMRRLRAAD